MSTIVPSRVRGTKIGPVQPLDHLSSLPTEIIFETLNHVNEYDVVTTLRLVSKRFNAIVLRKTQRKFHGLTIQIWTKILEYIGPTNDYPWYGLALMWHVSPGIRKLISSTKSTKIMGEIFKGYDPPPRTPKTYRNVVDNNPRTCIMEHQEGNFVIPHDHQNYNIALRGMIGKAITNPPINRLEGGYPGKPWTDAHKLKKPTILGAVEYPFAVVHKRKTPASFLTVSDILLVLREVTQFRLRVFCVVAQGEWLYIGEHDIVSEFESWCKSGLSIFHGGNSVAPMRALVPAARHRTVNLQWRFTFDGETFLFVEPVDL